MNIFRTFAKFEDFLPIVIIVALLALFGIIIAVVIYVKRHYKPLNVDEGEKVDEQTAVQQELDRVLVPIDDEEVQKEMAKKADEDEKK